MPPIYCTFIRAQDGRIIALPFQSNDGGPFFIHLADVPTDPFDQVDALSPGALREARAFARDNGTRLYRVRTTARGQASR